MLLTHCEEGPGVAVIGVAVIVAVTLLNSLYLPKNKDPEDFCHKSPPREFHNQQKLTPITRDKMPGALISNHLKRHGHKILIPPIYFPEGSFIFLKSHLVSPECFSAPPFLLLSLYVSPKL